MMTCGCDIAVVAPRTGLTPYPGAAPKVSLAGVSVIALYGPMVGGLIQNPATIAEQGINPIVATTPVTITRHYGPLNTFGPNAQVPLNAFVTKTMVEEVDTYGPPELLFISLIGPAALSETGTTKVLYPGQSYSIPANWPLPVWVNAKTAGHKFAAIVVQPVTPYPPTITDSTFPPMGPTGLLKTIPSYLYQQYTDDDDLQEFVDAYNGQTQSYVDWFNGINLPIYTQLSGGLLDWVGQGLYGVVRPTLYSGQYNSVGPYNTFAFNTLPYNTFEQIGTFSDIAVTNDDVYKRIITWAFYKGDGLQVSIPWLKRRIYRFLYGANGLDAEGSAAQISVVFGDSTDLTITIVTGYRRLTGGSLYNDFGFNTIPYNTVFTSVTTTTVPALAQIFKEAIDTGVLELPQQYNVTSRIGIMGASV
jgi:hypothetical protein